MTEARRMVRKGIYEKIEAERVRQMILWGDQNHPFRPEDPDYFRREEQLAKKACGLLAKDGKLTWFDILKEEFFEAFNETDPERREKELVEVCAVAVQIIEVLRRKKC